MNQTCLQKRLGSPGLSCRRLSPVPNRRRVPSTLFRTANASGKEQAADILTTANSDALTGTSSTNNPVDVVEATVLEPGVRKADSEASTSNRCSSDDAQTWGLPGFPEPSDSINRTAALQYGALAGAYGVAAIATLASALQSPQLLLPASTASDPWAATLLGCLAAAYLRGAGVFMHMKAGGGSCASGSVWACVGEQGVADDGELLSWRHQRLAATAALYGIVAAASQLAGAASLQLAGLQLALAVATAVVVGGVARSVMPFYSPLLTEIRSAGSSGAVAAVLLRWMVKPLTTVAGVLLLGLTAASLFGFVAVVFAPAPGLPVLVGSWPEAPLTLSTSAAGLRRLVGAGLLLAAGQALALLHYASSVRQPYDATTVNGFKKVMLDHLLRTRDGLAKYHLPDPATFTALNATALAAAALQAAWVLAAPSAGVDVNWDGPLWGPLYGTWVLTGLYGAAALTTFDWSSAAAVVAGAVGWAAGLVLRFFNRFVWKFEWAEKVRRL